MPREAGLRSHPLLRKGVGTRPRDYNVNGKSGAEMKPDIVSKLKRELARKIDSEARVVYLLAEIRKLLETEEIASAATGEPSPDEYFALKFHCDWAVHVRLDRSGAKRIVQRFDKYEKLLYELDTGIPTELTFLDELEQDLNLAKFREQLRRCLEAHGLDLTVTDDDSVWVNFLTYYCRVIEDAPLIYKARSLQWVDEVTVKVFDVKPPSVGPYILAVKWTWISKKTGMRKNIVRQF